MPAVPSFLIEPIRAQFQILIPVPVDTHPLGCHRPRVENRVVFEKIIQVLVLGCAYEKIADSTCSAATIRRRRDEWINAGVFTRLEQLCLEAYHRMIGLDLGNVAVDGCIVKAPCGGEAAGRSPVDRGKQGTKRSLLVDGGGIPLGVVVAGANRHDSPLLRPTLEKLNRFQDLPDKITVHLDAGYDSRATREILDEFGCDGRFTSRFHGFDAWLRRCMAVLGLWVRVVVALMAPVAEIAAMMATSVTTTGNQFDQGDQDADSALALSH